MSGLTRWQSLAPYVAACAIVIAFVAIAETVRPYYFLQDDNRDIFLPFYLHNYRAALDGQLAQYNWYQSLGKPHFATGQVAALHPVPYVSIFLSNLFAGHVFASVEILVLIYLLIGAIGVVYLIRLLGFSDAAGVFAATSWTLTPFNMLISQSWTTYPPMIGLMPWALAGTLLIYRTRFRAGVPMFLLSNLGIFYVGAPQFMLYAMAIEAGVLVLLAAFEWKAGVFSRVGARRALLVYIVTGVIIVGLSMPLLLPMWKHVQLSAFRSAPMSEASLRVCCIGPIQLFNGLVLPWHRFYPPEGPLWCGTSFPASFPHPGFLATIFIILFPWMRRRHPPEKRRVLDACFVVALLFLLAALGYLTSIIAWIPVANRFRWPFKYLGFAEFLFALCTVAAFDVIRARAKGIVMTAMIAIQFANLAVLDLTFPAQAFFEHLDPVPLHEPLRPLFQSGRSISIGWERSGKKYTIESLGYDYATLWELHYFGGYDPLVPARNYYHTLKLDYIAVLRYLPDKIPVGYLRRWGVRWYILNQPYAPLYEHALARRGLKRVATGPHRIVLEDPQAPPMVHSDDCTTGAFGRKGDDFTVSVQCRRNSLVRFRFLSHPYISATVDGRPGEIHFTRNHQQIVVRVPEGRHEVRLVYDDPWIPIGMWIALFTACASVIFLFLWRNRAPRDQREERSQ